MSLRRRWRSPVSEALPTLPCGGRFQFIAQTDSRWRTSGRCATKVFGNSKEQTLRHCTVLPISFSSSRCSCSAQGGQRGLVPARAALHWTTHACRPYTAANSFFKLSVGYIRNYIRVTETSGIQQLAWLPSDDDWPWPFAIVGAQRP
jgi:hypothetical protein